MTIKKRNFLFLIIIGVVIGLVISVSFDNGINNVFADEQYYIEADSDNTDYKAPSKKMIYAANQVKEAVVNIYTERVIKTSAYNFKDPLRDFFGDDFMDRFFQFRGQEPRDKEYKQQSLGSGVIVNKKGFILTNHHVIADADNIKVKLISGDEYEAKIIGSDKKSDIGVIKIEEDNLPFAKFGDSNKLEIGEWIIAVGNPFGLSHTVTAGIVSALGRNNIGVADYEDFIQTDASVNPGNSGGPIINLAGHVVGIASAIYSRSGGNQGIGFAIPINMAKKIMTDLIVKGKVTRGYLGVYIQTLTKKLAEKFGVDEDIKGVLVASVTKGSPADEGGMKDGDIIIEFDGKKVKSVSKLRNIVASTNIDKEVKIKVLRDSKEKELTVTIKEQPDNFDSASSNPVQSESNDIGIDVQEISPQLAKRYGYDEGEKGVIITNIKPGSVAHENGLQQGDIIKEINKNKINKISDFKNAIDDVDLKEGVLLLIKRGTGHFYLVLQEK